MEQYLYSYRKERPNYYCAVLFPNSYAIGMSNLGFQSLYHQSQLNRDWLCERFFYDGSSKEVLSYETERPLSHFHFILVSLSFEPDVIHLVEMLKKGGIDRERKDWPLVVIGGIGVSMMARTLAYFSDLLVTLRAESFVPILKSALFNEKKRDLIEYLSQTRGIYNSRRVNSLTLNWESSERGEPAHTVIISEKAEFADRALIELSRSCRYRCAFCLVSNVYGNYHYEPLEKILETALKYEGITRRLGLVAATLTNHPDFRSIIEILNEKGFELSFSAFRIEALDDDLLKKIVLNENRTLVIAPETASEKMKKRIRKMIPNELFLQKIAAACEVGIKRIKLYFMVGLPEEDEEDIYENIRLIQEVRRVSHLYGKKFGYIPEIIVDINPFVPKPFTSLANFPMDSIKSLKKKILLMKKGVRNLGRVFVYGESPRRAHEQYFLSKQEFFPDELEKIFNIKF